jgi:hypothetical protein
MDRQSPQAARQIAKRISEGWPPIDFDPLIITTEILQKGKGTV